MKGGESINMDGIDDQVLEQKGKEHSEHLEKAGKRLYISLHFMYLTGFYHILPVKDFTPELNFGFLIEISF